ncbi:MAG TPA: polysaccharide biosynthesis tyrosine autokinase [Candidatus Binatia bacterium]|nr:polysaccharide biosynthesis tyrosine autokinase [Candidatus Binatia bacterium]
MKKDETDLNTSALDLYAPANRFTSADRLHGRVHRWWLLLRRYWRLPVLIFPAVLGAVSWLTAFSGPTYESRARLWVTGRINLSETWSYTEELVNFLGTQVALLQSPAIQRRALARLLAGPETGQVPTGVGGGTPRWTASDAWALRQKLAGAASPPGSEAPAQIPFRVKVLEGAKSSTLELRSIGPDPVSTRAFLDSLIEEYLSFKRESHDQTSGQALASLNAEAARLKSELAAAQEKLQAFQASNNVVFLQHQGSGAENYLASLNRQLAILRTEEKLLESLKPEQWPETVAVQGGAGQASGEETTARQLLASLAQSQAALFQADQQMHLLMAQRDQLSHFLRPAHPKIIKLSQDIATQEQIVEVARDEAAKQLTLRRQAVAAQIRNLEAASKEWNVKAVETSRKVGEFEQLQQNAQRLQAAYDKTFGLVQNMGVANRVEQENVGILDPASAAKPTHRMLIHLAIGTVLALALWFALLYGLALFRDDFASHTELADHLAEPVVGQIPYISFSGSNGPLGIEGLEQQRFEFLEAFRNIRASLLFMNHDGPRPKTIVITSSVPEEGKSTVALYLAVTLAKANSRVLLIDGDMRRPGLHKYFGLSNGPGLAELLNEELPSVEVIFPAGVENLALLPAGETKRDPGDLVLSPNWAELLSSVKSQFDYILVDTPPVAATDDAAALAPKADGVLFVVRALSTSARVARGVLGVLRQRRAHVIGLIFNRAVSSPCERQYYEPYTRAYHWEPGPAAQAARLLTSPADGIKVGSGGN